MSWRQDITKQLQEAGRLRKIDKELKSLAKLLLKGDTRFNLIYSSSRDKYIFITLRNDLGKRTSKLLLSNGYKNLYKQWKN